MTDTRSDCHGQLHELEEETLSALELTSGAIATSGSDRRRWRTNAGDAHHLIDPLTGRPAETYLLRVTVVGRTAVEAEVLAKALYLAGAESADGVACQVAAPSKLTRPSPLHSY